MTVSLDTGVLYSLIQPRDQNHQRARDLVGRIIRWEWGQPVLSPLVISELFTLLRARRDHITVEAAAARFLPGQGSIFEGGRFLSIHDEDLTMIVQDFARYRDQKLSFVDASHLTFMRTRDIDYLATFDSRLAVVTSKAIS